MSTFLSRRLTTLALCALLGLTGSSYGSILREPEGGTDLDTLTSQLSSTDFLAWGANFSFFNTEQYDQRKQAVHQELETMGFQYGWKANFAGDIVSVWYSAALDMTMVCLESVTDMSLIHRAYMVDGVLGRDAHFLQ